MDLDVFFRKKMLFPEENMLCLIVMEVVQTCFPTVCCPICGREYIIENSVPSSAKLWGRTGQTYIGNSLSLPPSLCD